MERNWHESTCSAPEPYLHHSRTHEGVVHTDVHIAEVNEAANGECFDPETCCDARERALIEALRAYLRPEQAPECLLTRLRATLDHCCCEQDAQAAVPWVTKNPRTLSGSADAMLISQSSQLRHLAFCRDSLPFCDAPCACGHACP